MSRTFRRMHGDNIAPQEAVRHGNDHPLHRSSFRRMALNHPDYALTFFQMHGDGNRYVWSVDSFFMRLERRKSRLRQEKALRKAIRDNELESLVIVPMKRNRSRYY